MEIHHVVRHGFTCSALPDDTFRVAEFTGVEAVSQTFEFEVELVSHDADIDFEDVIDKPATLTVARGDDGEAEISGIVADFIQSYQIEGKNGYKYLYRVVLVPRLWRLSLSTQSRIFQDLTVRDIVSGVLDEAGVDHEWNLSESYEPREYTTQYKETDLDFVQRLLEFEGIRYYFRHEGGRETLVLSDDASDAPDIEGDPSLVYTSRGAPQTDAVLGFTARRRLVTGTAETKDYNYRTPGTELYSKSAIETTAATGVASDSMTHTMTQGRTKSLTVVRNEELESGRLVMTGTSNCFQLRTGFRFDLESHFRSDLNQSYLVTRVVHRGSEADVLGAGAGSDRESGYRNEFTCVPASVPYRPPRITPVPKLPGVLTAKVESAGGEYAPIDDQGRYRVRFPFDLGKEGAAQATKPVRLAQPYSGPEYGQHFPVHKDAEMVVACVDGNVDRIIGLSTVPNPAQASPVTSENQTENTIRTAAENHIVLDDRKGKVGIDIMTPTASSRIHLGADKDAVQGIQYTTKGTQTIQADGGVFIKVGKVGDHLAAITGSKDVKELMANLTKVDGAIGIGLAAIGAGKGFLKNADFWQSTINTVIGTTLGLKWDGLFATADGGILVGTPAGISAYAGADGIGLSTLAGIDLTAAQNGINLAVGQGGVNIGVGLGDIDMANGKGDIKVNSKTGNVLTEAHDNILFTSHKKNFHVQAPDASGNVSFMAGNDFEIEAKKNGKAEYGEKLTVKVGKSAEFKVQDKITFKCGQSSIVMSSDGSVTIKGGQNEIKLGASGIKVKAGTKLSMEGPMGVDIAGMQVNLKGDVGASMKVGGSEVSVNPAMAKVKGPLNMIG